MLERRRALATLVLALGMLFAGLAAPLSDRGITHTMMPMIALLDETGGAIRLSLWVDAGHAILLGLAGMTLAYAVSRGRGTRLFILQFTAWLLFQRWWNDAGSGQAAYLKLLFMGGTGGYVTAISLQIVAAAGLGFLTLLAIGPNPEPGRLRWPDLMLVAGLGLPALFLTLILTAQAIGPASTPLPAPAALLLFLAGLMALRTQPRKKSKPGGAFRLPPARAAADSGA